MSICLYLLLTTLLEKYMSANGKGIIGLTGRVHCQCQVAFFYYLLNIVRVPRHFASNPPPLIIFGPPFLFPTNIC